MAPRSRRDACTSTYYVAIHAYGDERRGCPPQCTRRYTRNIDMESASLAVNMSPESRRGHMECMTVVNVVPRAGVHAYVHIFISSKIQHCQNIEFTRIGGVIH